MQTYQSPLGKILFAADEQGLTGLWFEGQKRDDGASSLMYESKALPIFEIARQWLDIYFSGREPGLRLPLHFAGSAFQNEVWALLCTVPYGKTVTYGQIAARLAERRGLAKMSAQAVGGAVGKNPISIIIPCHRVVGANGRLGGYAGGVDRKTALLRLEKLDTEYLASAQCSTVYQ